MNRADTINGGSVMDLAAFAKWVIQNSAFDGSDLDGGEVQSKAVECGILIEVKYDPETHGKNEYSEYVDPGDKWYVFSTEFKSALPRDEPSEVTVRRMRTEDWPDRQ